MNANIDSIHLNFNNNSIWLLNVCLAIIMYGVALDLSVNDFKRILSIPKPVFVGILSQFAVLPALTFLLILLINPLPSIALGMILVAACPGGNISNFMTHLAKGNTALSITLTAFSTLVAVIMTPLNLAFWGNLYGPTQVLLREVSLSPIELVKTISLILGLPLLLGMTTKAHKPHFALVLQNYLRPISMLIFLGFIIIAFANNFDLFLEYVEYVAWLVILHNALALGSGYLISSFFRLDEMSKRSITIETGIQNSGLGLLLIFSFFEGLGGMAIIAALWGIWHIISGLILGFYWSYKSKISAEVL